MSRAIVERSDLNGAMRWVETPEIFTGCDAADFGPIAYSIRGNAHKFQSFEEAGEWVDENHRLGEFTIHPAVRR